MSKTMTKCHKKDCTEKTYEYHNEKGEQLVSCMFHKPMGWKRLKQ